MPILSYERWRSALNEGADFYNISRPSYPSAVLEDVRRLAQLPDRARILEVGCGTGQLTTTFADAGFEIVAVEPGPDLAAHARANTEKYPNVQLEVSMLEDYENDTPFDLVLAAQSFHLVDRARRFEIAASKLKPSGSLAIVYNFRTRGDSPSHDAMREAYLRFCPDLPTDQELEDTPVEDDIAASGFFQTVYMTKHIWQQKYSADEYVGLLRSHATHIALPDEQRESLMAAVRDGIIDTGGSIIINYRTRVFVAQRSP